MHVGIDGRELSGHVTGVGRFLQRILREWTLSPSARRHRFSVYSPDGRIALPPDFPGEVVLVPGAGGTRWEQQSQAAAARRDRVDVFFAPGYSAPLLAGVPFVVAIHDLSFIAHPEWFGWREGTRRRLLAQWSAARAARVITISEFSRHEIVTHLGLPGERIAVVYLGVDAVNVPATDRDELVLYVGSIFNRRNLPTLVSAFAQVAATRPRRGSRSSGTIARIRRSRSPISSPNRRQPTAFAREPGCRRKTSMRCTRGRRCSRSSPSTEGFGLTPLEALAAGASPLVLDTPVARETLGDAAVFVPRPESRAVAEAIDALLVPSSEARRAVLAAAPTVLARYRWPDAAAAVLSTLEEAARR